MITHRVFSHLTCVAAGVAIVTQTVFSQQKVKSELCNPTHAVEMIQQQMDSTRTFNDTRQRINILLRAADLLWAYRQPRARAAFTEALELASLDFKKNLGMEAAARSTSAPDQRYLVIVAIGKHDSDWASKLREQLLSDDTKRAEESTGAKRDAATGAKLLDAASLLLSANVNSSIQFARRSLSYPATLSLPLFLYKLAEVDQLAADSLYREALAVYRNQPMNQFLYLSAYPFGNDREAGDMPSFANYRVPKGFVPTIQLQRLFIERLLFRAQQTVANGSAAGQEIPESRQIWLALTRLEPQVNQRLPDLLPASQQARGMLFTLLPQDSQKRVTRNIANQSQPKKTFDEQLEAAEKEKDVDERTRLLVLAVMGVPETESLDRVTAVAERISDSAIRQQLLNWLYFGRSRSAIKDKHLDEARKRAAKVEELDQRAYLYSEIAEESLKTISNQTQARELLEEIVVAAAKAPNTIVTARTLLAAALLYTKVDMNRAISLVGEAIKSINRLEAPDFSRTVTVRAIEGKNFGVYASFETPGFDPQHVLRELAKNDFDTSQYYIANFEDKYLRALTTLTLAQMCLGSGPARTRPN